MRGADAGLGEDDVVVVGAADVHHRGTHRQTLPLERTTTDEQRGERCHHHGGRRRRRRGWGRYRRRERRDAVERIGEGRHRRERGRRGGHPMKRVVQALRRAERGPAQDGRRDAGHRLGIEAELLAADADHVTARQDPRAGNTLAVDDRAVGARIGDDVAVGAGTDLGMPPRDLGAHDDNFAAGIAAEDNPGGGDGVLPSVGQADEAPRRRGTGRTGHRRAARFREGECRHHLGASGTRLVDDPQLVASQRDLVAMQQRGRLRAQPHAIYAHFSDRRRNPNGRLAGAEQLHNRMTCQDIRALEENPRAGI